MRAAQVFTKRCRWPQMTRRYNRFALADDSERIQIKNLIGFAEEHYAKW